LRGRKRTAQVDVVDLALLSAAQLDALEQFASALIKAPQA
jgi:hypothetical protein